MEYNDEQICSIDDYENIAKAYTAALKSRGFMIIQVDNEASRQLLSEIFELMVTIKNSLFMLGGFLNTSKFYSLNERQLKKLALLYDFQIPTLQNQAPRDKTKCLLYFLSNECKLINSLVKLLGQTNYENKINDIISSRLSLLSQILAI